MFKSKSVISRRKFIKGLGTILGATALAACAPSTPPAPAATTAAKPAATSAPAATTGPAATTAPVSKYKESPLLADLVKGGKLPPVEKRLPDNPVVYKGPDGDGIYGGQLKGVELTGQGATVIDCFVGYEPLIAYNSKWEFVPNLAESWKVNEKGDEWTIQLRKGVKWSDGAPFTTKDVMFWWKDIVNDKDVTPVPAPPAQIKEITAPDDLTLKLVLKQVNVHFLDDISHPAQMVLVAYPEHFCKKYHAKYNPDAQKQAKDAGLERWQDMLAAYAGIFGISYPRQQSGTPTLTAWIGAGTERFTAKSTQFEVSRNPYFWKVDASGQQYPYVDRIQIKFIANVQAAMLEAAAGNISFQRYHINGIANRAFHIENGKKGNYRIQDIKDSWANSISIQVNQTHADEVHTKINRDLNFRIGLSHAINRKEMIDTLYLGMLKPHQVAPLAESPFYNKQLATQYLDYDVKKANEYLDKVLPKKDADGVRLGPDGKQYLFIFIAVDRENYKDLTELLARYWKAVGIRAEVRLSDRATHDKQIENHTFDCMIWSAIGGIDPYFSPDNYVPAVSWNNNQFGGKWARWNSNPSDPMAEVPPDDVKKQIGLFKQSLSEIDPKKNKAFWDEILQIAADRFYTMGVSTPPIDYYIINNDLKNIPPMYFDWVHGLYGPTNPWAFYYKKA